MADKDEIVALVLRPMLDLYSPPSGWIETPERLTALKNQFVMALHPYSPGTLARGWQNVVARHYGWSWPTLQEIIRECNLCS